MVDVVEIWLCDVGCMVGVFLLLCFGMGDVNCNGNSMVGCFVFGEIDVFVWL